MIRGYSETAAAAKLTIDQSFGRVGRFFAIDPHRSIPHNFHVLNSEFRINSSNNSNKNNSGLISGSGSGTRSNGTEKQQRRYASRDRQQVRIDRSAAPQQNRFPLLRQLNHTHHNTHYYYSQLLLLLLLLLLLSLSLCYLSILKPVGIESTVFCLFLCFFVVWCVDVQNYITKVIGAT